MPVTTKKRTLVVIMEVTKFYFILNTILVINNLITDKDYLFKNTLSFSKIKSSRDESFKALKIKLNRLFLSLKIIKFK